VHIAFFGIDITFLIDNSRYIGTCRTFWRFNLFVDNLNLYEFRIHFHTYISWSWNVRTTYFHWLFTKKTNYTEWRDILLGGTCTEAQKGGRAACNHLFFNIKILKFYISKFKIFETKYKVVRLIFYMFEVFFIGYL
jgi:hypothetical protein